MLWKLCRGYATFAVRQPLLCVRLTVDAFSSLPYDGLLSYFLSLYRRDAKENGFHDNLFLELETYHNSLSSSSSRLLQAVIQELSAANIFLVLNTGEIVTPSLRRGTILPGECIENFYDDTRIVHKVPFSLLLRYHHHLKSLILGVTRDSVLTLAREFNDELKPIIVESIKAAGMGGDNIANIEVSVSERDVCVGDLLNACEVFITGTAAEIVPVQSVATTETPAEELDGEIEESLSVKFPHGESSPGPVTTKLLEMLREVLAETRSSDATKEWLCDVYASPDEFRHGSCKVGGWSSNVI